MKAMSLHFTQPKMYKAIADHPTVCQLYANQLIAEGVVTEEQVAEIQAKVRAQLDADFEASTSYKPNKADWLEGKWQGKTTAPSAEERRGKTDVSMDLLKEVGNAISTVPEDFNLNSKLKRFFGIERRPSKAVRVSIGRPVNRSPSVRCCTENHLVRPQRTGCRPRDVLPAPRGSD